VDLSGGQWQRVALARAMYAIDGGARLLILDEPTANLDPRGEQELFDSVLGSSVARGDATQSEAPVTTILVSHRFATVRHADRIVVLEHGRIIEDGDHDALIAVGGRYAELFEAQAAAFREELR
jgi:ATP-binding cassette subfamily B protein